VTDLSPWLNGMSFIKTKAQYDQDGYMVFENVLGSEKLAQLRSALSPYLGTPLKGRNDFEGTKTNRVYAMLAKDPIFAELALHPLALGFAESDLGPSLRLSACLAIQLHRGETVQPWHYDDAHLQIPRPRAASGLSAFWAIDATTLENGATQFLRGSHLWGDDKSPMTLDTPVFEKHGRDYSQKDTELNIVTPELPAGSLMIAKSTIWHRGEPIRRINRAQLLRRNIVWAGHDNLKIWCWLCRPKRPSNYLNAPKNLLVILSMHPLWAMLMAGILLKLYLKLRPPAPTLPVHFRSGL